MPRVSVLMPVWNAGPFLEPAVASVLAQTETDLELLAVDDGSTDGSGQTLRRLAAGDTRLRLIDSGQRNEGIATDAQPPPGRRPPEQQSVRGFPQPR